LVSRTAWTIERKGHRPAFFQRAAKPQQGAHGVATAGSLHRQKSELADDPAHVLAVVTVAAHHTHAHPAADVGCGDHAGVPERFHQWTLFARLLRALFVRIATRSVEPISRMTHVPAQTMRRRTMRWRSV